MNLKQFIIQAVFGYAIFFLSNLMLGFNMGAGLGIFGEIVFGILLGVIIFRFVSKIRESNIYKEKEREQDEE